MFLPQSEVCQLFNEWETSLSHREKKPRLPNVPCVRLLHLFWSNLRKLKRNYAKKRKYQVFHYLLRVSNPPFFLDKTSICSSAHLYPCTCTSRMRRHSILMVAASAGVIEQGVCTTVYTSARPTLSCARIQLLFSLLNCGDLTFFKSSFFFFSWLQASNVLGLLKISVLKHSVLNTLLCFPLAQVLCWTNRRGGLVGMTGPLPLHGP